MLKIGTEVFTVSRIEVKHTPPYMYKTYVATKAITKIEIQGNDIIYTAGRHNELVFHAVDEGYQSIGDYMKPVFLSMQQAETERAARIAREGNEVEH